MTTWHFCVQLMMKGINLECILIFTFGTDDDENLFASLTEFFDSKEFTDGSGSGGDAQPETLGKAASPKL